MKEGYVVCPECKGNGFVKVPYEQAGEEQHANCTTCGAQGEVLDKDTEKYVEELKKKL
tara:strand:- start:648 stop:821 length:174 start_codon:yes stop_codon:yes gene_type:complete